MKCAICRNGMTESGYATVVLEKEGTTLVFKNVPAQICNNCGEEYISSEKYSIITKVQKYFVYIYSN
jgi:YgiT-type zinc finger domain-containing protein